MFQSDRRGTERKPQSIYHVSLSHGISWASMQQDRACQIMAGEMESQHLGKWGRKFTDDKMIILRRTYSWRRRLRLPPRELPRSRPGRRWPWPGWSARTKSPSGSLERIKMSLNEGREGREETGSCWTKRGKPDRRERDGFRGRNPLLT